MSASLYWRCGRNDETVARDSSPHVLVAPREVVGPRALDVVGASLSGRPRKPNTIADMALVDSVRETLGQEPLYSATASGGQKKRKKKSGRKRKG